MKIVGYLNPNGYYPSALTTLSLGLDNKYYLCYPNGERVSVTIEAPYEDFSNYIVQEKNGREYSDGCYAYGINEDQILFGKHVDIISQLKIVSRDTNLLRREIDLISQFINSTHKFLVSNLPEAPAQRVTLDAVREGFSLVVIFTTRVINHSKSKVAQRLLLQFWKNGSARTAYRKNISYKNTNNNMTVPISVVAPFMCTRT